MKSVWRKVLVMPAPIRVMVTIPTLDGIGKNAVKMDFNFDDDVFDVMASVLAFFNNTAPTATSPVCNYLSQFLSRATNACTLQKYDLRAPLAGTGVSGPPLLTQAWTLGSGLANGLPQEVAVALSYHATYSSIPEHGPGTRPKSRYRGRVYVGPLCTNASSQDATTHRVKVSTTFSADLTKAAAKLLADQPAWGVYSRVDRVVRRIVGGWVDDDFDIQRRRGTLATSRTNWGA